VRPLRSLFPIATLVLVLVATGCDRDRITDPADTVPSGTVPSVEETADPRVESLAAQLALAAHWEIDPERAPDVDGLDRIVGPVTVVDRAALTEDVVHVVFEIRTGNGPYDAIRLHRVVRERRPGRPIRAPESLFLLHGSGVGFEGSFLAAPSDPAERSLPVFLAENGIDVWGIDLGWTLVPPAETDLTVFDEWGLERDVRDLELGVAIARVARLLTGSGIARLNLLGWSTGESKGYVYLAREADRPRFLRNVKTFLPVDSGLLSTDPQVQQGRCDAIAGIEALLDGGIFADDTGVLARTAAGLAAQDPDGVSPLGFAPLTNLQTLLLAQSQTGTVFGTDPASFHLFAGTFDATGLPDGFRYVPVSTGIEFYASWAPYEPWLTKRDIAQYDCPTVAPVLPADFGAIEVPILYVGAGGGNGAVGEDLQGFVGSDDFRSLIVSTDANPFLDFGHADLFKAEDARALFWQPVLDWIEEHAGRGGRGGRGALATR